MGIQVGPGDLPPISTGSSIVVYGTPALHEALAKIDLGDSETDSVVVRLKRGDADVAAFIEELERLAGDRGYIQPVPLSESIANVGRAIGPLATALWLLAGLLALAGVLVVGQAVARQTTIASDDGATLRAVGMTPNQLWSVAVGRAAITGAAAALVAVVVAIALSPIAPIGIARLAEPDPGLRVDAAALAVGAAAVLIALPLLAAFPSCRAARTTRTPATAGALQPVATSAALARAGAPASMVVGAQLALSRGRGRTSVPVRTTVLGIATSVAALTAALGIGSSFDHLLRTPRLYGQAWEPSPEKRGSSARSPWIPTKRRKSPFPS